MDHKDIDQQYIAERYLMNQLDREQAGAFEVHFLDCPQCRERLEMGQAFRRGLKRVAVEELKQKIGRVAVIRAGWLALLSRRGPSLTAAVAGFSFLLLLAPLVLFLWVGNLREDLSVLGRDLDRERAQRQGLQTEMAKFTVPQTNTVLLPLSPQRSAALPQEGPTHRLRLSSGQDWLMLSLELDEVTQTNYGVTLLRSNNQVIWHGQGFKPNQFDALPLLLPTSLLAAGDYLLRVEAGGGRVYFSFRVNRAEEVLPD